MNIESQKKRERYVVEVNKKQSAKIIQQARRLKGLQVNDTAKFMLEAIEHARTNNLEGLELLCRHYINTEAEFDIDKVVNMVLVEQEVPNLVVMFSVLTFSLQLVEPSKPNLGFLMQKCMQYISSPIVKAVLPLIDKILMKSSSLCQILIKDDKALQALMELAHLAQLSFYVQSILSVVCNTLVGLLVPNQKIEELMGKLLQLLNTTNKTVYASLLKQLNAQVDNQITLKFIEHYMGELSTAFGRCIHKEMNENPHSLAVAQLLDILFYSEQDVVSTLTCSGFAEYLSYLMMCQSPKFSKIGVNCLECIINSNNDELTRELVEGFQLVKMFRQIFANTFSSLNITDIELELALVQCAFVLFDDNWLDEEDNKLAQMFINNCLPRLEAHQLRYDVIQLISVMLETGQGNYQKIIESKRIDKMLEYLAVKQKEVDPQTAKAAEDLLNQCQFDNE